MAKVIVVGGGLAGCAAAAAAAKAGGQVTLFERMDDLGGCGLVSGIISDVLNTLREELRLTGGYDIFDVTDSCTMRENVSHPYPPRTFTTFDVSKLAPELLKKLGSLGVEVRLKSRARDVEMDGDKIRAVVTDDESALAGDMFIDATGGAGPEANCRRYGYGCVMCFMRCPAFGGRVSIAARAGVKELKGKRSDGTVGPHSSANCIFKESLAPELKRKLEQQGYLSVPIPRELVGEQAYKRNMSITASLNLDKAYAENVVLADTGVYAKRIANGYTPLEELRKVPGFERAIYADPLAATLGNAIRYMALTPRNEALEVPGVANLFVTSEKLGIVGIGEVILAGVVAGQNAVRKAAGMAPLVLPSTTLAGYWLAYVNGRWNTEDGLRFRANMQSKEGAFYRAALELGLYTQDKGLIRSRIEKSGLMCVFSQSIV